MLKLGFALARSFFLRIFVVYKIRNTMTTKELNNSRNENGVYTVANEIGGWYAVSKGGVNMITFCEGHWNFAKNDDVIKFYTERGFATRITQLLNRGY